MYVYYIYIHVGKFIIPLDWLIFFRGVETCRNHTTAIPPTRIHQSKDWIINDAWTVFDAPPQLLTLQRLELPSPRIAQQPATKWQRGHRHTAFGIGQPGRNTEPPPEGFRRCQGSWKVPWVGECELHWKGLRCHLCMYALCLRRINVCMYKI